MELDPNYQYNWSIFSMGAETQVGYLNQIDKNPNGTPMVFVDKIL